MLWDSARPREWNSYPTRANEREKLTPAEPHPFHKASYYRAHGAPKRRAGGRGEAGVDIPH